MIGLALVIFGTTAASDQQNALKHSADDFPVTGKPVTPVGRDVQLNPNDIDPIEFVTGGPPSDKDRQTKQAPDDSRWSDFSVPFPCFNGRVRAIHGDYVAGEFTIAGANTVNHIAHFNGGSGDAWDPVGQSGMSSWIATLGTFNYRIVAGGGFTIADGKSVNRIAVLESGTWEPLGSGMNNNVLAVVQYNGELIAGGTFTTADEKDANYIARWDGNEWYPMGTGANHFVTALTVFNGELIAAGYFTNIDGVDANYIARWNGSTWQALGDGLNNYVFELTEHNGKLVVGGYFTTAGGLPANRIARWNGYNWQAYGLGMDASVLALTVSTAGELYAGGVFTNAGSGPANHLARWNGYDWTPLGEGVNDDVWAMAPKGDYEIWAGGDFTQAEGVAADHIARFDGFNCKPLGHGLLGHDRRGGVFALAIYNDDLIAGGNLTSAGGIEVKNIARWDGSSWSALGSGLEYLESPTRTFCYSMIVYNGELIAGGWFNQAGGVSRYNLAKWNGSTWLSMGDGANGAVSDMVIFGNDLIISGGFTIVNGVDANGIAKWDGTQWQQMGSPTTALSNPTIFRGELLTTAVPSSQGDPWLFRWEGSDWEPLESDLAGEYSAGYVYVLSVHNGDLIAGGNFTEIGGVAAQNIARWDGTNWYPIGSGHPYTVDAIITYNGELCIGGNIPSYIKSDINPVGPYLVRWDGASWCQLGSGLVYSDNNWNWDPGIFAFYSYDDRLIVGGQFYVVGGKNATYIASWEGGCDIGWDTDTDEIIDRCDNCPLTWNPGQWDTDGDGVGDACIAGYADPGQGESVIVTDNLTVTFDNVSSGGVVEMAENPNGPDPPNGFDLYPMDSPVYFEIITNAEFTDSVTICFVYDETQIRGNEANLQLRHYEGDTPVNITLDGYPHINENKICGRTDGFSPFAMMEPCLCEQAGDASGDSTVNIGDAVYLINYIFKGGPEPVCPAEGDANCDGTINIGDAVHLINYIFKGGPAPCCP